jgi:hypothetical protein
MATETPDRDLVEDLQRLRDDIRLKLHLGSMELKERWEEDLEPKWQEFKAKAGKLGDRVQAKAGKLGSDVQAKAGKVGDVADDAAVDIGKAARELGKTLVKRYQQLIEDLDHE